MSGYAWDLSGTDNRCDSYAPGHLIHWIHFNHSMREPEPVIPVTASVDDDGLVRIEGDDVSLVRWNHRPALLRDALHRFGGMAVWKPRWYILAVPTEALPPIVWVVPVEQLGWATPVEGLLKDRENVDGQDDPRTTGSHVPRRAIGL